MAEVGDGSLWFGTFSGGINRFDKRSNKFQTYIPDIDDTNSLTSNDIRCIYLDSSDKLWLGTWGGGLNGYDKDLDEFIGTNLGPANKTLSTINILDIIENPSGSLWLATWGSGLIQFNSETKELLVLSDPHNGPKMPRRITSLATDPSDRKLIWIGSADNGLFVYNTSTRSYQQVYTANDTSGLISNQISTILFDQSGNLWVGTKDMGLNIFDPSTQRFQSFPLKDGNDPRTRL